MSTIPWETVHIFISSTFNDMHPERDYLVKRVFPRLREWCAARHLHLVDVDLRWGVTEEDATKNRSVVRTCLERIDECRPFFLCFLGHRYGWIPTRKDLDKRTLKSYPEIVAPIDDGRSVVEMEILHALGSPGEDGTLRGFGDGWGPAEHCFFYLRNDSFSSTIPPNPPELRKIYFDSAWMNQDGDDLVRRQDALRARITAGHRPARRYDAEWRNDLRTPEVALPLRCTAKLEVDRARWREEWRQRLHLPVGEEASELDGAAATAARRYNHMLTRGRLSGFHFSARKEIEDLFRRARSTGLEAFGPESALDIALPPALVRLLEHLDPESPLGDISQEDIEQAIRAADASLPFEEVICTDLQIGIMARFPGRTPVIPGTPVERALEQQDRFLHCTQEGFVGREADLGAIDAYLRGPSREPLLITSPSGAGRTALLAQATQRVLDSGKTSGFRTIVYRFIGASDDTVSVDQLLTSIVRQIRDTGVIAFDAEDHPSTLRSTLGEILGQAAAHGTVVLLLDGLERLEPELDDFAWLLLRLPEKVKLVASLRSDSDPGARYLERLARARVGTLHPLEPLLPEERDQVVERYLSRYFKVLSDEQWQLLLSGADSLTPLYLRVVLSELRVFGAFHQLDSLLSGGFGRTPPDAFKALLRRLEGDSSPTFPRHESLVPRIFGLLAMARRGLSVGELTEAIIVDLASLEADDSGTEESVRDAVEGILRQTLPFLNVMDDRYALGFESLRAAARDLYVLSSGTEEGHSRRSESIWHLQLASLFLRSLRLHGFIPGAHQPLPAELPEALQRCLSELPFHLMKSGDGDNLADCLTDFGFVEAKIRAGRLRELIADYRFARDSKASDPLPAHDVSSPLAPEVLESLGRQISEDPSRADKLRCFEQFLSTDAGDLETYGEVYGHAAQQALNAADAGPVREAAAHWAMSDQDAAMLSLRRQPRFSANPLMAWETTSEEGHTQWASALALDPLGEVLVSVSVDATLRSWCPRSGAVRKVMTSEQELKRVVLRAGGTAAIVAEEFALQEWDLGLGIRKRRIPIRHGISALSATPDLRWVVTGHLYGAKLWDLQRGAVTKELAGHGDSVLATAITPDGSVAVSAGGPSGSIALARDHTLRVWDLQRDTAPSVLEGHSGTVCALALADDGAWVLSGAWDRTVRLWDLRRGVCAAILAGHDAPVWAVDATADGSLALSGDASGVLILWDLRCGRVLRRFRAHDRTIRGVRIRPDGKIAYSTGEDGIVRSWNLYSGQPPEADEAMHAGGIWRLAASPDGDFAVSCHGLMGGPKPDDGAALLWSLESGRNLGALDAGDLCLGAIAACPVRPRVLSAGWSKLVHVWDRASLAEVATLSGHTGIVTALAVSEDGRRAVSGSYGEAIIWDLEHDTQERTIHLDDWVRRAAIVDQDRLLLTEGDAPGIHAWDPETGKGVYSLESRGGTLGPESCAAGLIAAPHTRPAFAAVWDLKTGALRTRLGPNPEGVRAVALDAGGALAAVGTPDGTVMVWSVESGVLIARIKACGGPVEQLAFLQQGKMLLCRGPRRAVVVGPKSTRIGHGKNIATLWSVRDSRMRAVYQAPASILSALVCEETVVLGTRQGAVRILEASAPSTLPQGLPRSRSFPARVRIASWHPSEPVIAVAVDDGLPTMIRWHESLGLLEEPQRFFGATPRSRIADVRWSEDGMYLFVEYVNGKAAALAFVQGHIGDRSAPRLAHTNVSSDGRWRVTVDGSSVAVEPHLP